MFNIGPQELFVLMLFLLPLAIIPGIFYALTLYRTLDRCAPESRAMEPGLVWLLFIPLFNLVWSFVVVSKIATSVEHEFQRRGVTGRIDAGRELGLAMNILACIGLIPIIGILPGLAGAVCGIVYWSKIASLSARLVPAFPAPSATA